MSESVDIVNELLMRAKDDEYPGYQQAFIAAAREIRSLREQLAAKDQRIAELGQQLAAMTERSKSLKLSLDEVIDNIRLPPENCSCHISPPCQDCVEFSELRAAVMCGKSVLLAIPPDSPKESEHE
jgi:hypothetical protein